MAKKNNGKVEGVGTGVLIEHDPPAARERVKANLDELKGMSAKQLESRLKKSQLALQVRLAESQIDIWDNVVDPREAFMVGDELFVPIGYDTGQSDKRGYSSEDGLKAIRDRSRRLAAYNEFAINAQENRISYLVGTGYNYSVVAVDEDDESEETKTLKDQVQDVIDTFIEENDWGEYEQEFVRRAERDGEAFIRKFRSPDGKLYIRAVEPEHVKTPTDKAQEDSYSFGIQTEPNDTQEVIAYWVDEGKDEPEAVLADRIEHIKLNVDKNSKRGLPTYFPVFKNLERAEKLLRNMSTVAAIKAAIAMLRKHSNASKSTIQSFVDDQVDYNVTFQSTGKTKQYQQMGTAERIDVPMGQEYEFPMANTGASEPVGVLQAELRAVASRLVMPEFMLSADASNANYSSTLVAESPFVKFAIRQQKGYMRVFKKIIIEVVDLAIFLGLLPVDTWEKVELQVEGPSMIVRDELKEVQALQIERNNSIISPQTWCNRRGYDYDQEQANLDEHHDRTKDRMPTAFALPGQGKGEGEDDEDDIDDNSPGDNKDPLDTDED